MLTAMEDGDGCGRSAFFFPWSFVPQLIMPMRIVYRKDASVTPKLQDYTSIE